MKYQNLSGYIILDNEISFKRFKENIINRLDELKMKVIINKDNFIYFKGSGYFCGRSHPFALVTNGVIYFDKSDNKKIIRYELSLEKAFLVLIFSHLFVIFSIILFKTIRHF